MLGHIETEKVGQLYKNRRALHDANIHRGLMNGIAPQGASIVLSGGYIDDIDEGNLIIYTGEGGRDPNSGRQVTDQTFTGGNFNLAHNGTMGTPIRVNRGYQLSSPFAPAQGYRYDGLYQVEEYWSEKGKDGYLIWRFRLTRIDGQPLIGTVGSEPAGAIGTEKPSRGTSTISRVIRNTEVGTTVKEIYDYRCQICNTRLETPSGAYAECCHIKPLGKPHNGPDTMNNVLCLCPNCHVLFDLHALSIDSELKITELGRQLTILDHHLVSTEYLTYRNHMARNL